MSSPTDDDLESALRRAITGFYDAGSEDDLTVRRVRAAAEEALGLDDGFFKADARWSARSKTFISDEVDAQEKAREQAREPDSQPDPAQTTRKKASAAKRTKSAVNKAKSSNGAPPTKKRRNAPAPAKSRKRAKVSESESDAGSANDGPDAAAKAAEESDALSSVESEPVRQRSPVKKDTRDTSVSPVGDADQDDARTGAARVTTPENAASPAPTRAAKPATAPAPDSDSELSSLIDEAPPPKKKRPRQKITAGATEKPAKPTKRKKATAAAKPDRASDPQEQEVKRLQGWLVKCGIRKLWHRELAGCASSRAKIAHLREMLREAGMEGRPSLEKAREIRERREMAADLEAVTEGNRRWGKEEEDEEEEGKKGGEDGEEEKEGGGRRLARGLRDFAFLEDDGEETD